MKELPPPPPPPVEDREHASVPCSYRRDQTIDRYVPPSSASSIRNGEIVRDTRDTLIHSSLPSVEQATPLYVALRPETLRRD